MAVLLTNLLHGSNTASQSSYVTASIAPAANHLLLLLVDTRINGGPAPNVPTVTGNGLTWVQIATDLNGFQRLTLFRALGASPTTGAITIDYAGQAQTSNRWVVDDCAGMDVGGTNGSGAIVQFINGDAPTGTSFSVTLSAFASANNGTYGGFAQAGGATTFTAGTGFTLLGVEGAGDDQAASEWRNDNSPTVGMSSLVSQGWIAIAVELKAASPDSGFAFYRPYTLGAAVSSLASGLFYYWRRRKQEKPDE